VKELEIKKMCQYMVRIVGFGFFFFLNAVSFGFSYHQREVVQQLNSIEILNRIKKLQTASNYDSASILIQELSQTRGKKEDPDVEFSLVQLTNYYHLGQYDSMKIVFSRLDKLVGTDHKNYPNKLYYKALILSYEGFYQEAIQIMIDAAKGFDAIKDENNEAQAYNSLGVYFRNLKDYGNSYKYYIKSVGLNKKIKNNSQLVRGYNNLGGLFSGQNQLDSALYYYDLASVILNRQNNFFLLAQNTLNRGNIFEKKGDYAAALRLFEECLEISTREKFNYGIFISKLNLGNLARITKDFEKAELFLSEVLLMSRDQKLRNDESFILERLSWLKRDQKDYEKAYQYSESFHALSDSLMNDKIRRESAELLEKYESEKKTNEILVLNDEKQNFQFFVSLLVAGILVLILIILWIEFARRKAKLVNTLIEKEKITMQKLIDAKDKELMLHATQILRIQNEIEKVKNGFWEILLQEIPNISQAKKHQIHSIIQFDEIGTELLEDFDKRIIQSNEDFFRILLGIYPDLKPNELKLCAYLRLNLSTKEMSDILNKSARTIETIRFSIRKKMNLSTTDNLVSHLIALEKGE
jgi:tetratricopeptide (TPR) repeat protein